MTRLIVIVNGVGDAVLALPLVRVVRRRWPDDRLVLVCQDEVADAVFGGVHADIVPVRVSGPPERRVVTLPDPQVLPARVEWLLNLNTFSGAVDRFIAEHVVATEMRGFHPPFDAHGVVLPPGLHWRDRNFLIAGIDVESCRPGDRALALTPDEERDGQAFVDACAAGRRVYVLHADTSSPDKMWPAAAWHRVLADAYRTLGAVAIVVGHLSPRFWAGLPFPVYDATHYSIRRTAAIIQAADAFAGVDSSFAHVADALAVPMVGLYGPVSPEEVGPSGPHARFLRGPAGRAAGIAPGDVLAALADVLASRHRRRGAGGAIGSDQPRMSGTTSFVRLPIDGVRPSGC